jgi:protein-L-isoaspartate(D-aspartate) O-methyltransferase
MQPHRWHLLTRGLLTVLLLALAVPAGAVDFTPWRARMVEEITAEVRLTRDELGKPALDERVLQVLSAVPRHEFVPDPEQANAYDNRPLPIGEGQTISQPYIVAIMTDLLELKPDQVVFELGTGSGYQAAILAGLVRQVYTMEIIPTLGDRARQTLQRLGYRNVEVRVGDGYYGWEEHAPYDAIVVTAAADHIPPSLVRQLKPGGRMIIPVGSGFLTQQLMLITKADDGAIYTRAILPVRFVPLTGGR